MMAQFHVMTRIYNLIFFWGQVMTIGDILKESDLPIMYAGFSPCFRREAGAAGKDTRGLIRVHQFSKVEQYIICKADVAESDKMHQFLLSNAEEIMQALEIPYQVVACCTGDMGAGKYRMNDIEAWCPAQERYIRSPRTAEQTQCCKHCLRSVRN